ncbi:hypothetical protein HK44_020830 [Pseudomonas fluorescens HK44]|uniref:Uncharacterized protein n=1 Tax=Pseudomonas fluorescens HK44 TaxID=1042209 RepID=A0A010S785_PSEFL|nr:hypothetical protein HK44_020830 [Pseudomonas fluorescens HK44]
MIVPRHDLDDQKVKQPLEFSHSLGRLLPYYRIYQDRDSNPFLHPFRPPQARKYGAFVLFSWRPAVYGGPEFALILP